MNIEIGRCRGISGNSDHTLKLYVGLGHSLGLTPSSEMESFAPLALKLMNDMARWLRQHEQN